jgi:hypothetical protein
METEIQAIVLLHTVLPMQLLQSAQVLDYVGCTNRIKD